MDSDARTFDAVVVGARGSAILVPLPFDPDDTWGARPRHHVTGRVGAHKVRGVLAPHAGGHALKLGPAWTGDHPVSPGDTVEVTLAPEGPQRATLDADLAAALAAEPEAAASFDGLAQFYRKLYLAWVGGTKSRPDERARRIAEAVRLLKAGVKQPK